MFRLLRRLVWLAIAFALGVGSSFAITRRLRRVAARYAPPEVAGRFRESVTSFGHDVRDAVSEGRDAMRRREAELRAGLPDPRPGS